MESKAIPQKIQSLIKQLGNYTVTGISTDPLGTSLRLDFRSTLVGGPDLAVILFRLVLLNISKTLEDDEDFVVGEARLTPVEDGGKELFTSLGYGFRDPKSGGVATYPSSPLFHFYLEGGICIDAVCVGYEVLLEIKE